MDARLFDGAFPAGHPHALRAAAPGSVRAHSLGRDRDGDRLARGHRRRRAVGRAGGRRDPRSLLKDDSGIRAVFGFGRHNARTSDVRPYVRRTAAAAGSRPRLSSAPGGSKGTDAAAVSVAPSSLHSCPGPRTVYGKLTNRSLKSVAFAASPSIGVTPKISSIVRSVELWV